MHRAYKVLLKFVAVGTVAVGSFLIAQAILPVPWNGIVPLLCLILAWCRVTRGDFRFWEL